MSDELTQNAGDAAGGSHFAIAFLRSLHWLRRRVDQYPPGHSMIADKVAELYAHVQRELARTTEIEVAVVDGALILDGMLEHQESSAEVLHELTALGVDSIRIRDGVRPDELLAMVELLCTWGGRSPQRPVATELASRDVQNISLSRLLPIDTRWYGRDWPDAPTGAIDPDYEQALLLAQNTFASVTAGRDLNHVTIRDLVQLLIHRVAHSDAALGQILAVKQYENLTYVHSVNVSMLSLLIGRRIGLAEADIGVLVEAALLHDIGKTRISLDILRKPGVLTAHERRQMELHTTYGAEILVAVDGLGPLTPTVALEHHRGVRGTGYPDLGASAAPHAMSQIVSVADVYEAVTGARSYKDPTPPERACLILARAAGTQLNAALVKAFVNTVTFFPVGSFVRTSRDEIAVVIRINPRDPLHPLVALLDDAGRNVSDTVETSARSGDGTYLRHLVETVTPPVGAPDLPSILPRAPAAA